FGFELQRHATFVAVDREEVIATHGRYIGLETIADIHVSGGVTAFRFFDFDNVCSQVAKHHRAIGARYTVRQVEYFYAFEWSAHVSFPSYIYIINNEAWYRDRAAGLRPCRCSFVHRADFLPTSGSG